MKMKRIMSLLLAALTISASLSGILGSIPAFAAEASTTTSTKPDYSDESFRVEDVTQYNSVEAKVQQEIKDGHTKLLAAAGDYSLYCNIYSGEVYYKNRKTGKYVTTNPYNLSGTGKVTATDKLNDNHKQQLSQIIVRYTDLTGTPTELNSFVEAAQLGQIAVTQIRNGIRVSYTMGRTDTNYLVPGWIVEERFNSLITTPIRTRLFEFLCDAEALVEDGITVDQLEAIYQEELPTTVRPDRPTGSPILALGEIYSGGAVTIGNKTYRLSTNLRSIADQLVFDLNKVVISYTPLEFSEEKGAQKYKDSPLYNVINEETGKYYMVRMLDLDLSGTPEANRANDAVQKRIEFIIKTYCTDTYNYDQKAFDTEQTGYVAPTSTAAVFRMALEYILDENGALSVILPANGVRYDASSFTLLSVAVLPYFGAGRTDGLSSDANGINGHDGYVFYPDGSGALLELTDLAAQTNTGGLMNMVYGEDQAYYTISEKHQESIRMPVFGIVDTKYATSVTPTDTMDPVTGAITTTQAPTVSKETTGFVAYLTEGESLATLRVAFGGSSHKFASVYPIYTPVPHDSYTLVDSISATDSNKAWTVVSDKKYTGNFTMQVKMLVAEEDATLAGYAEENYYDASWVGMAQAYRDYLWNDAELVEDRNALTLYIESFGSVQSTDKILSIPVTVDKALTTFADVETMYKEIAQKLKEAGAASANLNFKLTGFANGGMYATYPAKLNWMGSVGGKEGLESLLNYVGTVNTTGDSLAIYPEFEFSYNSVQAAFDGTSLKDDISRTVDNRYASKQMYDCLYQQFTSYFDLVVSPDAIARHFAKFSQEYTKLEALQAISAGTLGSDLNSSFYDKNSLNREDSKMYVTGVLKEMQDKVGSVMVSGGNVYTLPYVDHVLDAPLTSSQYKYNSRSIPFYGMVMHGYVNYAGSPTNEVGDSNYQILKSIENGASLYYVLSYQNTSILKDDFLLSHYYSIRYDIWLDDMVKQYTKLNNAIGDLQNHIIVNEISLTAERVLDATERHAYMEKLKDLAVATLEDSIFRLETTATEEYRFQILVKRLFGASFAAIQTEANALLAAKVLDSAKIYTDYINAEADYSAAISSLATKTAELEALQEQLKADPTNETIKANITSKNAEISAINDALKAPALKLADAIAKAQKKFDEEVLANGAASAKTEMSLASAKRILAYNQEQAEATKSFYANNTNEEAFFDCLRTVLAGKLDKTIPDARMDTLREMYAAYATSSSWDNMAGQEIVVEIDRDQILASIFAQYANVMTRFAESGMELAFKQMVTEAVDQVIAEYYGRFIMEEIYTNTETLGETLTPYETAALYDVFIRFSLAESGTATIDDIRNRVIQYLADAKRVEEKDIILTAVQEKVIEVVYQYILSNPFVSDFDLNALALVFDENEVYTTSKALDQNYKNTSYTFSDDSVVLVIYEKDGQKVGFVLNYNVFSVDVRISATEVHTISSYDFLRLDHTAVTQLEEAWKEGN